MLCNFHRCIITASQHESIQQIPHGYLLSLLQIDTASIGLIDFIINRKGFIQLSMLDCNHSGHGIVGKDENVEVPSVGGRPPRSLQRQTLAEVIEPRYTELLNLVNEEILQLQEQLRQQGVKHHLAAGIVLTGGAAQIEGLAACAQRVFHTQVRIGAPLNITGLTDYAQEPYYSTAVGLLHYGKESHLSGEAEVEKRVTASVGSWIKRLNSWLRKEC